MQSVVSSDAQIASVPSYASTKSGQEAAFKIFAAAARLKTIYGSSFTTPAKLQEAQRLTSELLVEVGRLQQQCKDYARGPGAISYRSAKAA